jgi:HSP20 family protein
VGRYSFNVTNFHRLTPRRFNRRTEDDMAEKQAEKEKAGEPERSVAVARREPSLRAGNPFGMLQRFADEMDRVFDDFGVGRGWLAPRLGRRWFRAPGRDIQPEWGAFGPDVDVLQRGNELVIRADVPGLKKDDIKIDVTEDSISIQGERKREYEEERGGVYRAERSYGSFSRVVPLPEGTITDQAKATFDNGVLEITMPAPPEQVTRGRRLEITEGKK